MDSISCRKAGEKYCTVYANIFNGFFSTVPFRVSTIIKGKVNHNRVNGALWGQVIFRYKVADPAAG